MSEKELIKLVDKMCIESLSPDAYEKWEDVKKGLKLVRKGLKDELFPGTMDQLDKLSLKHTT